MPAAVLLASFASLRDATKHVGCDALVAALYDVHVHDTEE